MDNDTTKSALLSRYAELRPAQMQISFALRAANDWRWVNMYDCGRELSVAWCSACGAAHVRPARTCKHRLCPLCQLRRARRLGAQASAAYAAAGPRLDGVRMALVTLTQRNVKADQLRDEVGNLLAACSRLRLVRTIRRDVVGSARNVEITYNRQQRTYHPHVHMIIWLRPGADWHLMGAAWWREHWRALMGLDYDPVVDVSPIEDVEGSIAEVSKYCAKTAKLSALPLPELARVVDALDYALAGRRLIAYSGLWATLRRELAQPDPDAEDDHDELPDKCDCGAALVSAVFRWAGCEYVERPETRTE